MDTYFARRARALPLEGEQRSLVIGSLLGDGTLLETTAGYCFRVHHGLAQSALVEWKYRIMASFVRSEPRESGHGIYFRTVSHPAFSELRGMFYDGKRKIIPFKLLESAFDPLALAVWIMDDGASDGRQLRLNTQCFTFSEVVQLSQILYSILAIETTINLDKERFRLRCKAASMARVRSLVGEYIIPEMRYKLSL
jgi:hypothetical protein